MEVYSLISRMILMNPDLMDLHGFVAGLVVEGDHLTAAAPHGHRAIVVARHALGLRVHPRYLRSETEDDKKT